MQTSRVTCITIIIVIIVTQLLEHDAAACPLAQVKVLGDQHQSLPPVKEQSAQKHGS